MTDAETPDLIDALQLLGEVAHEGYCCTCCDDYCLRDDGAPDVQFGLLLSLTIDGAEYLTDRYIMARRDLLTPVDDKHIATTGPTPKPEWSQPESKPPEVKPHLSPLILNRLHMAGLTTHEADDPKIVHLYRGDQYVGISTINPRDGAPTADDLDLIYSVANAANIALDQAWSAIHAIRQAAS